jgi:hypothetical protein
MKIRIKGNSLRYRLTRGDVDRFSTTGYIEETIDFGNQTLVYAIQQSHITHLSTIFENNKIILFMPKTLVNEWASTEKVGFAYEDNGLFLLVEKDFKCLDNVAEDQSDNYANPHSLI